jgi:hypothetical protein
MPSLHEYLGQRVVLDTASPTIYIGYLEAFDDGGFWLKDADVHDRSDGYSTKEEYINESHQLERSGSQRVNRKRVFVDRRAVISFSALADVIAEDLLTGARPDPDDFDPAAPLDPGPRTA